jgi:hypothetical protein
MPVRSSGLRAVLLSATVALAAAASGGAPQIALKLPAFPGSSFPNFSSVAVPALDHGPLELWLEDALDEVRTATLRVRLNDMPMTPFVNINPLPHGVRAVVRLGTSVNPDYTLRPNSENILAFSVEDQAGMKYQGQFYLRVEAGLTVPRSVETRARAPVKAVEAPAEKLPPVIDIRSQWPARTTESILDLEAEVTDALGLKRIVLEVNGKDTDEILLENEWPVRKHDGFMVAHKAAGEVRGDGRSVWFSIPVKLGKDITVVAVRAENAAGLRARADRTVERQRPEK